MSADRPPFRHNQPAEGERVVRENRLLRHLEAHDKEIGLKLTVVMDRYHAKYVEPLMARVEWLEKPWWGKVWFYLQKWEAATIAWVRDRVRFERIPPRPPAPVSPPAEPEPPKEPGA